MALPANFIDTSETKRKALQDATKAQSAVVEECSASGESVPPYELAELIGKGSFGRVYKAIAKETGRHVAIKIISIEEGDSLYPRGADTFGDILREVNTLKLLGQIGARNINTIIDTLLVGQSVWVVTQYCAGGSVATLMRPTGGLAEAWIIPILREVSEAIQWIHKQGIIHRDIKCANVLVLDSGDVQLCDFGVAGIIESKFDKRSTVTGTLQWMAPELFESATAYGAEVDIWAFGSMVFEVASGLPPNATSVVDMADFGSYLKLNCPRLEGHQYSDQIKDLVAFCMVADPANRPQIEEVQRHPYIFNTASQYPTSSLAKLVEEYRLWERQGGNRFSLFSAGGAPGPSEIYELSGSSQDWSFDTTHEGDDPQTDHHADTHRPHDAYRQGIRPYPSPQRRRRGPRNIRPLINPLQQVFDPAVETNYEENSLAFYAGKIQQTPVQAVTMSPGDPARISAAQESLIDLDVCLDGTDLSHFVDMETLRANTTVSRGGSADPDHHRRTQDWTFPFATRTQAEVHSPAQSADNDDGNAAREYAASDGSTICEMPEPHPDRASVGSLIDLDASVISSADMSAPLSSPSTQIESADWEIGGSSKGIDVHVRDTSEPTNYVLERASGGEATLSLVDRMQLGDVSHSRKLILPSPPAPEVLLGTASKQEVKRELRRMVSNLEELLQFTVGTLKDLELGHNAT
ncbi:hypothetical protein PLICBS_010083 [Purpureocillium lilacinum]|uniref:uncharacterized protein n=1 Tax=Purpureocillium lilacinum TaxID=33203 RepID=UPI00208C15F8|nr:hypothetical protein PLICBS_010083 [Purpureocillium lilacinum]